jgi:hypothetical protein
MTLLDDLVWWCVCVRVSDYSCYHDVDGVPISHIILKGNGSPMCRTLYFPHDGMISRHGSSLDPLLH